MSKNKGFDFVADAQERANHNINPYYWFNRVTPYTMAQWKVGKRFSIVGFFMYSIVGILTFIYLYKNAMAENTGLLAFIFDFSDSATSARAAALLMFCIFWVILGIGAVQSIIEWINAPLQRVYQQPAYKQEKKKKTPKRPKNWS